MKKVMLTVLSAGLFLVTSCSKEESLSSSNPDSSKLQASYVGCGECPITIWGEKTDLGSGYPAGSFWCPGNKSIVCHKVIDIPDVVPADNTVRVDVYSGGAVQSSITGVLTTYSSSNPLDMKITTGPGYILLVGDYVYDYQ